MSISLLSLVKTYSDPLQKARRATGQFVEVPQWIKEMKNSSETIESTKRSQAKRILSGAGKLSPEDFQAVANTRNLDLIGFLADRKDLTPEQAKTILHSDVPFERSEHHMGPGNGEKYAHSYSNPTAEQTAKADAEGFQVNRYSDRKVQKKKDEAYNKLIPKAMGGTAGWQDFLKNTSEDVLRHILKKPNTGTYPQLQSGDLFHIITERPKLGSENLQTMMRKPEWDAGHMTELMNRPEAHLKATGLANLRGDQITPSMVSSVFRSGDPETISSILNNASVPITNDQLQGALKHQDGKIVKASAQRLGELLNHTSNHPEIDRGAALTTALEKLQPSNLDKMIERWHYYTHRGDDYKPTQEHKAALIHRLSQNPHQLSSTEFVKAAKWSPEEANQIVQIAANAPSNNQRDRYSQTKPGELIAQALYQHKSDITPESLRQILAAPTDQHFKILTHVLDHPNMTPELVKMAAQHLPAMENSYEQNRVRSKLVSHPQIDPETLLGIVGTDFDKIDKDTKRALVINPSSPRALWESMAFGPDPYMRQAAAENPIATSEDVTRGLADEDKNVRHAWIKSTPTEKMTPEHWKTIVADRAPINRALAAQRNDMPPEALRHFLLKDKAGGVNLAALNQITGPDGFDPALIGEAIKQMSPHSLASFGNSTAFSKEQTDAIHKRLIEDKVVKMAKLNKQATDGKITPEDLTKKMDALKKQHGQSLLNVSQWKNLSPDTVHSVLAGVENHKLNTAMQNMQGNDLITPDHWDKLLDRSDLTSHGIDQVMSRAQPSPERWAKIASGLNPANYKDQSGWHHRFVTNPSVPPEVMKPFLEHGNHDLLGEFAGRNSSATPEMLDIAYESAKRNARTNHASRADGDYGFDLNERLLPKLAEHQNISPDLLTKMYEDALTIPHKEFGMSKYGSDYKGRLRQAVVRNSKTPEAVLQRAMNDPDEDVAKYATETIGQHNPDMVNGAIGGHEVFIHPAVEKLKDLKGTIQGLGGVVNKRDLPNKGQGVPSQLLDGKGNISTDSIDKFIDALPKERYNVSYSTWNASQRHDETKPQKVLQLNITNPQIKAIKDAGLWDVFSEVHKASFRSGHPVRKHSLGWARIDDSKPGHWHIDEIQSDLGQGSIRMVEKAKNNGQISPEKAKTYIEGIKGLIKIFSGSFKNINHAIFGAVHQAGREQGVETTSMDLPYDQAAQSWMTTHHNASENDLNKFYDKEMDEDSHEHGAVKSWAQKNQVLDNRELGVEKFKEQAAGNSTVKMEVPLPGHMISTYKQFPEDVGYKPADKKEVMPDSNSKETQVQYRKLIKSLQRIREIYEALGYKK